MTAFGTAQTAIEAMKYGAFDYLMKPFDPPKVLALVDKRRTHADLRAAGDYKPSHQLRRPQGGDHPAIRP